MSQSIAPRLTERCALLAALRRRERYDLAIVGGGATGLGLALDAAARGYRVALVEAYDFAKGTSSRCTKLLHGGVR
jgi:glycerol-3-phosphate dehydrogenase